MFRIDTLDNVPALPAALAAAGPAGYFGRGVAGTGSVATTVTADWANMLQEELAYVIEQAGITLDKANHTQLRSAITAMFAAAQKAVILSAVTFNAGVATGNAVYYDTANNRFDKAVADGSVKQNAVGFADAANLKVYAFGDAVLFAGLTPGPYFLDPTTPGAITPTAPAVNVVSVGIAKSATEIYVDIDAAKATTPIVGRPQTASIGPMDSNGFPNFLPATAAGLTITGQNISGTAPLCITAGGGYGSSGSIDINLAPITANPTWSGLTNSAVNYLGINASTGAKVSTTTAPIYQWGGTPSNSAGQYTYIIENRQMYLGNGSAAIATPVVFIGEATTSGGNVTAAVAYAYQRKYRSVAATPLTTAGVSTSFNHNLGVTQASVVQHPQCWARNLTTESGWNPGDVAPLLATAGGSGSPFSPWALTGRNTLTVNSGSNGTAWTALVHTSGAPLNMTNANWEFYVTFDAGW